LLAHDSARMRQLGLDRRVATGAGGSPVPGIQTVHVLAASNDCRVSRPYPSICRMSVEKDDRAARIGQTIRSLGEKQCVYILVRALSRRCLSRVRGRCGVCGPATQTMSITVVRAFPRTSRWPPGDESWKWVVAPRGGKGSSTSPGGRASGSPTASKTDWSAVCTAHGTGQSATRGSRVPPSWIEPIRWPLARGSSSWLDLSRPCFWPQARAHSRVFSSEGGHDAHPDS
jgi:hypothetical protein